ncbi:class A beta-lactamase-related serine hydrolase [bacterium]|nr:class A beta-lactamase-related serine hydrolase [bacterium]
MIPKIFLLLVTIWLPNATSIAEKYSAESIGIYFEQPDGKVFERNAYEIFHAASTMKVPVMMEVFKQIEAGKLNLDQKVTVKNQFSSIMDGSPYSLTQEDDSDADLYKEIGKQLPLKNLVDRMINSSSNLATNIIIEMVKAENVQKLMKEIGAKDMTVLRGVEDIKAFEAGKNNRTSARSLAICYKAILDPKLFKDTSRNAMIEILRSQHSQDGIGAGVKAKERGLKVASKDGWITEINHDSGIIEDENGKQWIMVIMTRGVKEEKDGWKLIAELANEVWNHKETK